MGRGVVVKWIVIIEGYRVVVELEEMWYKG